MDPSARYFEPVSRLQLASKMRHLLRFSDLLLLIVGEDGCGRSTLLQQLAVDERSSDVRQALIQCDETVDVTRLLSTLVAALGVDCPGDADNRTRLKALHTYSRTLHEAGVPLILLIDDADFLTNNALELLINFALLEEGAPRVVLTGTSEFEQRFVANGFDQTLDGRLHVQSLAAFEPEEAREFIEELLPPGVALSPRRLRQLIEDSRGLPGRLSAGLRKQMHDGGLTRSRARSLPMPGPYAAVIGGVLLAVLGVSVWLYLPSEPTEQPEETTRVVMPLDIPVAAEGEVTSVVDVRSELQQKLAEQERKLESQEESAVLDTAEPVGSVDEEAPSVAVEPEQVVRSVSSAPTVDDEASETQEAALVEQKPVADTASIPVTSKTSTEVKVAAPRTDPPRPTAEVAKKVEAPTSQSVSSFLRADELLQWPDKGYTLQLLGAREASSVEAFIKAQKNPERFYYFRTLYKGAPWHVVVYGQFSDRASATAAVQTLPAELRKLRPWARSIAGVKSDIRK
ncbi:DamX, an inner membrane protein involved in bile resistance [Marinobacterium lacunae]|uniref:DamX, an inner membrane protein involved in bile resistance n=1 Tax=Marinobacterium lacunae TaxID=1232683 RepID=A0A081G2S4_9GAMM|nr:AAA family ATPase [Marinobacterium lacunae]KEA65079.1 DamX, an inner membrane protein involved in bile resistance [Marinobacterium lacunae]